MRNHRRTVALFGSSSRGQQCRALLQTHPVFDLLCFFDNNPDKWGTTIDGLPVLRPDAEAVEAVDFILIASMYVYEIHAQLEELGVGSKIALSVPDLESRLRGPAPGGGNETTRTSGPSPDPASAETAEAVGRFIDRWRAGAAGDGERTAVVSAGTAQFGPAPAPDLVACTVCSNNYIGYATVLARSFLRHHPRARFVLCLTDRRHQGLPYPDLEDSRIEVIEAESLGIPEFERSAFRYGPVELNCAVKPFLLDWLFAARSAAKVIYLDPDILVLDTLQPLVDLLDRHAIALVPHITSPYLDDRSPSELDLLQVGTFNLGFIALRSADQSRSFLAWWQSRVHRHGAIDTSRGIFVDQKWIDLVPSLFADHVIVRDPGYDVAYWNLHEREVTFDGDRFQVNGQPLRFYHFSGFDARCTDDVSKFQNRIALPDRGPLRILFEIYRRMVIEAGHLELAAAPYAYGRFSNDVAIGRAVRRAFSVAPAGAFAGSPFDVESGESLFAWLNQPVRPGSPLTHLLASIRDRSPELRAAFGANDPESERKLVDYIRLGARVHGLDASFFSHLEPHRKVAGPSQPSLAAEQPLVEAPAAKATEGAAPTCGSAPRSGDAESRRGDAWSEHRRLPR